MEGKVTSVLYHGSAYVEAWYTTVDEQHLVLLARYFSGYLQQMGRLERRLEARPLPNRRIQHQPIDGQEMLAESDGMKAVVAQADRVAAYDSTILILGETGVGKELLARRIHSRSARAGGPLVVIEPSVFPEHLVESELFGHEKGAFTGADCRKRGLVELAHGGTLFIDEIGEIPPAIQVKLLRVLQEKAFKRVGGSQSLRSDFRLIAATNRVMAGEVDAGRFRRDLYHRINTIELTIPPLRERTDDLMALARLFLAYFRQKYRCTAGDLGKESEERLRRHHWPGNVRELKNVVERAVILAEAGRIVIDVPAQASGGDGHPFADAPDLDTLQRRYIRHVLNQTGGRVGGARGAARILGLKRTTLYNRMRKLGIAVRGHR